METQHTQEERTKRLQTLLSETEYSKLERLAEKSGKKLNPFVRDILIALIDTHDGKTHTQTHTQTDTHEDLSMEDDEDDETPKTFKEMGARLVSLEADVARLEKLTAHLDPVMVALADRVVADRAAAKAKRIDVIPPVAEVAAPAAPAHVPGAHITAGSLPTTLAEADMRQKAAFKRFREEAAEEMMKSVAQGTANSAVVAALQDVLQKLGRDRLVLTEEQVRQVAENDAKVAAPAEEKP